MTRLKEGNRPALSQASNFSANRDRSAVIFVWAVLIALFLTAAGWIIICGRNIPLGEDWTYVSALTGHEHNIPSWAWAQYNEHRIPLPRLLLLMVLRASKDFRAGMFLNAFLLAGVAALMIRTAQILRNGRTSYADAFFPIALLNFGNAENLFWSCNFAIVLPAAIVFLLLALVVIDPLLERRGSMLAAIFASISLPFSAAIGIVFAPFSAIWLVSAALNKSQKRIRSFVLIASAFATFVFVVLYFKDYRSTLSPPPPDPVIASTMLTATKFIAMSFGIGASPHLNFFMLVTILLLITAGAATATRIYRASGQEPRNAGIMLILLANTILFAVAVGWGRAGQTPYWGLPARYTLLALPAVALSYCIAEKYLPAWRRLIQYSLFALVLMLLPVNTTAGLKLWNGWYVEGMQSVERDLRAGVTADVLADKHRNFLIFFMDRSSLVSRMKMLHHAGIGPMKQLK